VDSLCESSKGKPAPGGFGGWGWMTIGLGTLESGVVLNGEKTVVRKMRAERTVGMNARARRTESEKMVMEGAEKTQVRPQEL